MDISILPKDFEYASAMQLKFFKSATIREICESYNKYKTQRDNTKLKKSIDTTRTLLDLLESKGYVYSYIDPSTSWLSFNVIDSVENHNNLMILKNDLNQENKVVDKGPAPELTDFSKIVVTTDEEAGEVIEPDLKSRDPLLWQLKVATKYTNIIKSAVKRQLEFNLDIKDIEDLVSQRRCFYTGVEFDSTNLLTFDRVNHELGYVKGNVVACTTQANALKNSLFEVTNGLFTDITTLKRFVDIVYIGMSKSKDPLTDLLIFK